MRRDLEVELALARSGGVISLRRHRELARAVYALAKAGDLVKLYPAVYVTPGRRDDPDVRIAAARWWRHDAVFIGRSAARLTFWPDLAVPVVELAVREHQRSRAGVVMRRRLLPPSACMVHRGMVMTRPALTAVDLIGELGGAAVCEALRKRIRWDEMWSAVDLIPGRDGHHERRQVLREYRHLPWSEAEQRFHQLLRLGHLRGWIANFPLRLDAGHRYLDVAFPELRVAIEIDGYAFHIDRGRFESDRRTASELTARGWRVLRFTWRHLDEDPGWVLAMVRATLRRARANVPSVADFDVFLERGSI